MHAKNAVGPVDPLVGELGIWAYGEATLVGSEKQKGESCIGEGGSELPLQLSTYY